MDNLICVDFARRDPIEECGALLADFHAVVLDVPAEQRENLARALNAFNVFAPFWFTPNSSEVFYATVERIFHAWWSQYGIAESTVVEGLAHICTLYVYMQQLANAQQRTAVALQLTDILRAYH